MALIKWGALVTDGRGKLGGQVLSKNRTGAYIRNKVTPVNPQTTFQSTARNLLAQFSAGWRSLSQAQRDAWNAAVSNWQTTNIFADVVFPTGKNLYTKLNVNLANIGEPSILVPPSPVAVNEPVITEVTISASATFEVLANAETPAAGQSYLLFATPPVSAGVGFVKNLYKMLGEITITPSTATDVTTLYASRIGTPVEGMKICVKLVPVVDATGQKGIGSEMCAIVEA